jgi:hypothetical protein
MRTLQAAFLSSIPNQKPLLCRWRRFGNISVFLEDAHADYGKKAATQTLLLAPNTTSINEPVISIVKLYTSAGGVMILIAARVLQHLLVCHRYEDCTRDDDRDRMRTVDGFLKRDVL